MADSSRMHETDYNGGASGSTNGTAKASELRPVLKRPAETGRTILVGILGGIASAVGYAVYQRLPEEQKERLHSQVRGLISSRLNELRSNFNL